MQNYYGVERAIQERTQEARAMAELQAIRRRAQAERRATRIGFRGRLRDLFALRERTGEPVRGLR